MKISIDYGGKTEGEARKILKEKYGYTDEEIEAVINLKKSNYQTQLNETDEKQTL